jgi:phosphoglycerate dehydrogenase-like enzyme
MKLLIENGTGQIDALRVGPEHLYAAFSDRAHLLDGFEIVFSNSAACFAAHVRDAEIIFAGQHLRLPQPAGASLPLRWVQSMSAGIEDMAETLPPGTMLTNASGVHAEKGGEFILAAVLMLNYRIPGFVSDKAAHRWQPVFGGPLAGKRISIVGVGAIGSAAVPLLNGLGAKVTGVTRSGNGHQLLDRVVPFTELDSVLSETDTLVSTVPLTRETRNLLDRRRIGLLPDGAGVINVGRAETCDYDALEEELRSGRLGGAILDVFGTEPLPESDTLWDCPNLIISPHCSLDDHTTYRDRCLAIFADNLQRLRNGEPLENLVDRTLGY